MSIITIVGILVGAYVCYILVRNFAKRSAIMSAYRREMYDLLTNEKYQVKGRFD